MSEDTARRTWPAVLLIAGIMLFYLVMQREGHNWGGDFSLYVMHARNIVQLHDYSRTPFVFDSLAEMQSPPVYPPGFPILLAPVYGLSGLDYRALKAVSVGCLLLSLWPIYLLGRRRLGNAAIFLIALTGLTFPFISFKDIVGSDGPYVLVSFIALAVMTTIYEKGRDGSNPIPWAVLSGALMAVATQTRTVGMALPAALGAYDLLKNRRVSRFLVVSAVSFVAVMLVTRLFVESGQGYAGQFTFGPSDVARHLDSYAKQISYVWENGHSKLVRHLAWAVLSCIALLGLGRRVLARIELVEWYAFAYMAGIASYHASDFRYLLPIVPIYILWVLEGTLALPAVLPRRAAGPAVAAAAALMLVTTVGQLTKVDRDPILHGIRAPGFREVIAFLSRELAASDVVVAWNPRVFALYTGKRSLPPPADTSSTGMLRYFAERSVTHVVVALDEHVDQPRRALTARNTGQFREVYANPHYRVYRLSSLPRVNGSALH